MLYFYSISFNCFFNSSILSLSSAAASKFRSAAEIIENKECISVTQLDINGSDIAALGAEGKEIGDILARLLSLVIEGKVENIKFELIKSAKAMMN